MKATIKLLSIILSAMMIFFCFASCDDESEKTYEYWQYFKEFDDKELDVVAFLESLDKSIYAYAKTGVAEHENCDSLYIVGYIAGETGDGAMIFSFADISAAQEYYKTELAVSSSTTYGRTQIALVRFKNVVFNYTDFSGKYDLAKELLQYSNIDIPDSRTAPVVSKVNSYDTELDFEALVSLLSDNAYVLYENLLANDEEIGSLGSYSIITPDGDYMFTVTEYTTANIALAAANAFATTSKEQEKDLYIACEFAVCGNLVFSAPVGIMDLISELTE